MFAKLNSCCQWDVNIIVTFPWISKFFLNENWPFKKKPICHRGFLKENLVCKFNSAEFRTPSRTNFHKEKLFIDWTQLFLMTVTETACWDLVNIFDESGRNCLLRPGERFLMKVAETACWDLMKCLMKVAETACWNLVNILQYMLVLENRMKAK